MITTINNETLTVFEMTGKDVKTLLNNQVVSELNQTSDSAKITAICNPKGRIVFTVILQSQANITYVAVDASLGDNFLQYINMRRFRMDLEINKSSFMLGIKNLTEVTDLSDQWVFHEDASSQLVGCDEFMMTMFQAGLPWITAQSSEAFVPQHLNMDQLGIIDFDKGCYPGQEIVARLHFLGKVKKRMQYIQYQATHAHKPLTKVQIPEYDQPLELCSSSVFLEDLWHAQAVIAL